MHGGLGCARLGRVLRLGSRCRYLCGASSVPLGAERGAERETAASSSPGCGDAVAVWLRGLWTAVPAAGAGGGEPRRQPLAPDCGVLALGRTRGLPQRSEARFWVEGRGCYPAMPGTLAGARREIFPSCRQDLVILCGPLESFVSPSK